MTSSERAQSPSSTIATEVERDRRIAEAAERALAEAAARREATGGASDMQPTEKGGQSGPDPARYGDWEKDGIVSDF